MKGKYHKENCECRLCSGKAGFQIGHKGFIPKEKYKEIETELSCKFLRIKD